MIYRILFVFFLISFVGCIEDKVDVNVGEVVGLRPLYVEAGEEDIIKRSAPRDISRLGKIYYKDPYIFINESNLGVHVLDNSDPTNPLKLHFIEIPGCEDIAIKGNFLYADNLSDLVTVNIADLNNPTVVNRIEDVKPGISIENSPPNYQGYFECIDNSEGTVVGWTEAILNNPQCLTF